MYHTVQISIVALIVLIQLHAWNCFQLSTGPYPLYLASLQRTGEINRPVLCPDVSQGRSTVLQITESFSASGYITRAPVMDADGSIYIAWFGSTSVLYKLNANLTVLAQVDLPGTPISSPTILDEGIIVSTGSAVYLHRKSDLQEINSWAVSGAVNVLPYGDRLVAGSNTEGFLVFNDTSTSSPTNNGVVLALRNNKIYGIDTATYDVFEAPDGSPVNKYLTGGAPFIDFTPSIFGSTLVALDGTYAQLLDLNSLQFSTIPTPSVSFSNAKFYKNGKLYYGSSCPGVGSCLTEATTNTTFQALVDQEFIYSVNDDVLLTGGSEFYQLTGLHLASNTIKLVFEAPSPSKKRAFAQPMHPLIGDKCAVYYPYGGIFKLEPMPLRRVIPILECIDPTGRMYFGYRNLESEAVKIPRVHDRNNIAELNNTPFKNFFTGRTVPYPASNIFFQAVTGIDTYTWVLEDYELTFNKNNAALKCPTTFTLLISIRSSAPILPIHLRILERVVSFVTGVSAGRIRIVPANLKRSVMQDSTLEAELTVYPTNSTTNGEPSSQQIAETFVYDQAASVNAALVNDTDVPLSTEITSVSAKPLDNSVEGQQVLPPVASPAVPVSSPQQQQTPQSTPIAATNQSRRVFVDLTSLFAVLFLSTVVVWASM